MIPESGEATGGLALAHLAMKDAAAALRLLRDTAAPHPELRAVEVLVLTEQKMDDEAEAIRKELEGDSVSSFGHFLAAQTAMVEGHDSGIDKADGRAAFERARRSFEYAVALSPTARLVHYLGFAHAMTHLPEKDPDSPLIEGLIVNWPDNPHTWTWAGKCCDDPTLALERLDRAETLDPTIRSLNDRVGRLIQLSRFEEAAALGEVAIVEHPDDPTTLNNMANALANLANLADEGKNEAQLHRAISMANRALELDPDHAFPHLSLCSAYRSLGRIPEALIAGEEAVRRRPLAPDAHSALAATLTSASRGRESVAHWKKAMELRPGDPNHDSGLGTAYMLLGDASSARPLLKKAVLFEAEKASSWLTLASAHSALGENELAAEALAKALDLDPKEPRVHVNIALDRFSAGDLDGAEKAFGEALEIDPKCREALERYGPILIQVGRPKEGIEFLKRALAVEPDAFVSNLNLGIAYETMGQPELGLPFIEKASEGGDPRALYTLARSFGNAGRVDDCMDVYRRLIVAEPQNAEAHCNLGDWYRQRGDMRKAIEHRRKGHELGSRRSDWNYPSEEWLTSNLMLGALEFREKDPGFAISLWREFLDLKPDNPAANAALADLLVDPETPAEHRDPHGGLVHALRAAKLSDRKHPLSLHVLAKALFHCELLEEAVKCQRDVVALVESGVRGLDVDDAEDALDEYTKARDQKK